jgi:hypothetical protein
LDEVLSNSAHKTENGNEEFIVDLSNSKMTPKLMQRDLKRRSRAPQNCRCTKKKTRCKENCGADIHHHRSNLYFLKYFIRFFLRYSVLLSFLRLYSVLMGSLAIAPADSIGEHQEMSNRSLRYLSVKAAWRWRTDLVALRIPHSRTFVRILVPVWGIRSVWSCISTPGRLPNPSTAPRAASILRISRRDLALELDDD